METTQMAAPALITLLRVQRKYKKDYCWPSQNKILELLEKYQGIRRSRATLNRWLKRAEEEKYIMRRRRIKRDAVYGMIFKSTLYKITIKGYHALDFMGVGVYNEIKKYITWREEKKQREKNETREPDQNEAHSEVEPITKLIL